MQMRTIGIALGVFLLLIVVGFGVMIYMAESGSSAGESGSGTETQAGDSANSKQALEAEVLEGYEVKNRFGGVPVVRFYDPGGMEWGEQTITQALFAQSQYGRDAMDMGAAPAGFDPGVAGYKYGLVHEHGLFGQQVNLSEAVRYYRIARVYNHTKGDAAATRLEAAGH